MSGAGNDLAFYVFFRFWIIDCSKALSIPALSRYWQLLRLFVPRFDSVKFTYRRENTDVL